MADKTAIEWATHTFSPWLGCTKVSPACHHCYAEAWAKRTGSPELWAGERRRTSKAYWQKALKWEREAVKSGERPRIFPSLCDPFDNQVPENWVEDFFDLIWETTNLDWLLLTKRPQNIARGCNRAFWPWANVWLGTTAENQEEADRRIPHLLSVPAAKRFISAEPLLGPVNLSRACGSRSYSELDWVIVGGESGPGARPMQPNWARSLRGQCSEAGVSFFMKQMDKKTPIPADLLVREFPA